MAISEKPRHNTKVKIQYIDKGRTFEAIGYYMFCGADYGFVAAGFYIPEEQVTHWEYVNI